MVTRARDLADVINGGFALPVGRTDAQSDDLFRAAMQIEA